MACTYSIYVQYKDGTKTELSSFKTLGGDRSRDFLTIFENFEFIFVKAIKEKIHTNKKVVELHFMLAHQLSKHWDLSDLGHVL